MKQHKISNTNRLRYVFCTGFFVLIQFLGNTQITENQEFLLKTGIKDSLYSKSLKEYRGIYIQLPENFNSDKNRKYPVVYILDGEVLLPAVANFQSFYSVAMLLKWSLLAFQMQITEQET